MSIKLFNHNNGGSVQNKYRSNGEVVTFRKDLDMYPYCHDSFEALYSDEWTGSNLYSPSNFHNDVVVGSNYRQITDYYPADFDQSTHSYSRYPKNDLHSTVIMRPSPYPRPIPQSALFEGRGYVGQSSIYDDNRGISYDLYDYSQFTSQKCRQLPCRTWISTGSCPYGDRCVFLHDPRVISKAPTIKGRRKSQEDLCQDSLFWPTMSRESVNMKLDSRNLPHISQYYIVPHPSAVLAANQDADWDEGCQQDMNVGEKVILNPFDVNYPFSASTSTTVITNTVPNNSYYHSNVIYDPTKDGKHVSAVYSMWSHFLDFCSVDVNSIVKEPRSVPPLDPTNLYNSHIGKRRLNVFVTLSQGKEVADCQ